MRIALYAFVAIGLSLIGLHLAPIIAMLPDSDPANPNQD